MLELEDLDEVQMKALNKMQENKQRVARESIIYKKVKTKSFEEEELVCKTILLVGMNDHTYGKWSSRWEGPYQSNKCSMDEHISRKN